MTILLQATKSSSWNFIFHCSYNRTWRIWLQLNLAFLMTGAYWGPLWWYDIATTTLAEPVILLELRSGVSRVWFWNEWHADMRIWKISRYEHLASPIFLQIWHGFWSCLIREFRTCHLANSKPILRQVPNSRASRKTWTREVCTMLPPSPEFPAPNSSSMWLESEQTGRLNSQVP